MSRTGVAGGAIVVMVRKGFLGNARAARRSQAQLRLHGVDKRRIHGSTSDRFGGAALSGAIGACGTSTSPGQPADVLFFRNDDPPPDKSASGCSPRAAAHGMNLQPLVVGPRGEAWAGLEVAESTGGRRLLSLLRLRVLFSLKERVLCQLRWDAGFTSCNLESPAVLCISRGAA